MPRTDDLARLFNAVAQGDLPRARVVAEEIAAHEERAGKPGAASSLRKALVTRDGPRDLEASLLSEARLVAPDWLTPVPASSLDAVKLPRTLRAALVEVATEHRHRDLLRKHGLAPRNRLLFHGPPGCGKTITARAVAGELGLPVFVVRFDALLGAYLGQTSARVNEVFRFAAANECVVLIDEIDAVGRRRGHASDVAELDRVVISLMQLLDLVRPAGLIITASNVPTELDPALVRRFDFVAEFPAPGRKELSEFAKRTARTRGVEVVNGVTHALASATTYAEVEGIIVGEQRRLLLRRKG
jgi:SpoVK/Ycf46/Vps4 family AAA+-type ATPase